MKSVRRHIYRLGYPVALLYWRVRQPQAHGVRVIVRRANKVLLVRHSYGDRMMWNLPGGGIKREERPKEAARRELYEEVGITSGQMVTVATIKAQEDFRHCTIHGFSTSVSYASFVTDGAEIAEARWFGWQDLPHRLRPSARSMLSHA